MLLGSSTIYKSTSFIKHITGVMYTLTITDYVDTLTQTGKIDTEEDSFYSTETQHHVIYNVVYKQRISRKEEKKKSHSLL